MNDLETKKTGNFRNYQNILARKIWFYEMQISESIYKFWCKISGGKFEKREKERPNNCVLITKKGFHLISNILSNRLYILPSKLEAYQLDCPEKVPFGFGQIVSTSRFFKNLTCENCGRCYKVEENDKKIIGKF